MSLRMFYARSRVHLVVAPLSASILFSGCASTISPQLFPAPIAVPTQQSELSSSMADCSKYPERLSEIKDVTDEQNVQRWPFGGQERLCRSRMRADLLRQAYVRAVVDQSAERNVLNTFLLGIGGATGYQLLRHGLSGNTATLRYLAAAGSMVYGYATLTQSQARHIVYLTGAEALTCIYAASDELQISPAELEAIVKDDGKLRESIQTLRKSVGVALANDHNRADRCKTKAASRATCETSADGPGKKLFDAARPKGCSDKPASRTCDGRLAAAAAALEPEIKEAEELLAQVTMKLSEIERTGGRVHTATDNVSYAIGREVLKTEASAATVLTTLESMRNVMSQLMGSAQSGPKRPGAAPVLASHSQFEVELNALRTAKAREQEHERTLSARLKAFPDKMSVCQGDETMARIAVSPSVEQLTLVPERSFTLLATGSKATPSVNLMGDSANAVDLQTKVNGNQLEAVLTLKKADRDVAASVQFSAPGAVSVSVPVAYYKPLKPGAK